MYRLFMIALAGLFLAASQQLSAQNVYTDTNFDIDSDWTVFGPFNTREDSMDSDFTVQQQSDNQNLQMEVTLTRGTVSSGDIGTWAAVINNTLVWDPSDPGPGPVGAISVDFDLAGGGAWSLTVQQGEFIWMAVSKRVVRTSLELISASIEGLVETDFIPLPGSEFVFSNQPAHPDFSLNGAPVSFGVGVGLSCPSTADCTRISPTTMTVDNLRIEVCPKIVINAGLNDAWFNAATAGQGLFFTVFPDLAAFFLAWFTYDTDRPAGGVEAFLGEAGHRWLTAFGFFVENTVVLDVELTSGGVFDAAEPAPMQQTGYGTITIFFCSCNKAVLTYNFPSLGLMGEIELTRIANDNVLACEMLNAELLQMQ